MASPPGAPSGLKHLRLTAGLTKRALAQASGVSVDTIRRAEAGVAISEVSAWRLATALHVDVDALAIEIAAEASA